MATAGIHLFEADPDLLQVVPEDDRAFAMRTTLVRLRQVGPGPWQPDPGDTARWGALVLEGVLAREVAMATVTAAELIGPGELIGTGELSLCGSQRGADTMVAQQVSWSVLESARLALLDDRLAPALRRWPELAACLLERAERRAGRLAMGQAIGHLTRIDARVLAVLWLLADRWGRVSSDGVVLPLTLTHRMISHLIGARRPSVTTALTDLGRRGLVRRRDDGAWLLCGPPPGELARAGVEAAPAPGPAPRRRPASPTPATAAAGARGMAAQIERLVAAYETETQRSRTLLAEAETIRDSSRVLRDRLLARRSPDR